MNEGTGNGIAVENRSDENATITMSRHVSRPYDFARNFLETVQFQSIKSDSDPGI